MATLTLQSQWLKSVPPGVTRKAFRFTHALYFRVAHVYKNEKRLFSLRVGLSKRSAVCPLRGTQFVYLKICCSLPLFVIFTTIRVFKQRNRWLNVIIREITSPIVLSVTIANECIT
jgi:uncharacterized protein YqhQ